MISLWSHEASRRWGIVVSDHRPESTRAPADDRFEWAPLDRLQREDPNFRDIRRTLQADGVDFRTSSDTEVILEAYNKWGIDAIAKLDGMFAFAIWDERQRRLVLARDRVGEKPLYYQVIPGKGLIFASDLQALRKHPRVSTGVSLAALGQYLSIGYVVDPDGLIENVRKLEPAHYLVAGAASPIVCRRYWDLAACFRSKSTYRSEDAACHALDELLSTVVGDQLVSDVPVGAFLSGGVDSAAVLSAMRRLEKQRPLAFTIGFPEATYDEAPQARESARTIDVELHEKTVRGDLVSRLPESRRRHRRTTR